MKQNKIANFPRRIFTQKTLIALIPYLITFFGILLANLTLGSGGSGHVGLLAQIRLKSIVLNALYYVGIFSDFFAMPNLFAPLFASFKYSVLIPNALGFALFLCAIPLIYRGFWAFHKIAPRENTLIALFVLGTMALFILWPGLQGIRFVFCVLPFLVFYALHGAINFTFKRTAKVLTIAIFIFFALKSCTYISLQSKRIDTISNAFSPSAMEAYSFIRANIPQDSVIAFWKPRVLYLNTRHLSFATHIGEVMLKARFVLDFKPDTTIKSAIYALGSANYLTPIFENELFVLYEIKAP